MARFNEKKTTAVDAPTKNRAGGPAYDQSPKLAFASLLVTNMMKDQYYRSASLTVEELRTLLRQVDTRFAAKAGLVARFEYGLRSISHVLAGELAPLLSGTDYGSRFYEDVIRRPDDVTEILSYFQANVAPRMDGNPKATAAMKKGLGYALTKFDEYQLDKYAQRGKVMSLHDAVNILHPHPTPAIDLLMTGDIKQAETWEKRKSAAGESEEESDEVVWKDLLAKDRLGFFATLRNLRNIAQEGDRETLNMALNLITNRERVHRSGVLPFNITKAHEAIREASDIRHYTREEILKYLNDCAEIALDNVPEFEGATLVMVDVSASMCGDAMKHAALFGAALYKATDGELILYNREARWMNVLDTDLIPLAKAIERECGGSTDCPSAFRLAAESGNQYDRIVVLTDNQSWAGHVARGDNVKVAFKHFKEMTNHKPLLYNFDFTGYGELMMPEDQVISIAGFSPKVFDTMQTFEKGANAVVDLIESVSF